MSFLRFVAQSCSMWSMCSMSPKGVRTQTDQYLPRSRVTVTGRARPKNWPACPRFTGILVLLGVPHLPFNNRSLTRQWGKWIRCSKAKFPFWGEKPSWVNLQKPWAGTTTGIYPDNYFESEISNLILNYIWAKLFKIFPMFNHLVPYCRVVSTLSVSGIYGTWPGTSYWRLYYATWITPKYDGAIQG